MREHNLPVLFIIGISNVAAIITISGSKLDNTTVHVILAADLSTYKWHF